MFTFTGFSHVCSTRTLWPRSAVFAKSWKFCPEPCRCVNNRIPFISFGLFVQWWPQKWPFFNVLIYSVCVEYRKLPQWGGCRCGFCSTFISLGASLKRWRLLLVFINHVFWYEVVLKSQKNSFNLFFWKAPVSRSSLLCWGVQTFPVYEWLVMKNFKNIKG